jgi:hypothetical protein
MKIKMLFIGLVVVLVACSKEDKAIMDITSSKWFTTTGNGFGDVNLVISGSTNADKVLVECYGDGLITEKNVVLDSKNNFSNDTCQLSFFYFGIANIPTEVFTRSAKVRAIKGTDTLLVVLKSGDLKY